MNKIKLLAASMLLLASGAMAQSEISNYQPGVTPEGAVYYLPKTVLRFTVYVEKTSYTPGDFCKYADRYLRLNEVGQEPAVDYKVLKVGVSAYGEADKRKAYAVKYNAKSVAANVKLADDGRLLAINTDNKDNKNEPAPFVPARRPAPVDPHKYLNEDILSAGSTAKMAELTAQDIYEIRDSKNQLNRGEADFMPKDGEQLRIMLNNLDLQDRMMTQLFSGTVRKDTTVYTFVVCPEGEVSKQVLFRLSRQLGVVDKDDLSGVPYYLSVADLHSLPEAPAVEEEPKKKKKNEDTGIFVNIPGKVRVTVFDGAEKLSETDMMAGQFGKVELLSAELFNKRATTRLMLNPVTGAVDRLDAELPK